MIFRSTFTVINFLTKVISNCKLFSLKEFYLGEAHNPQNHLKKKVKSSKNQINNRNKFRKNKKNKIKIQRKKRKYSSNINYSNNYKKKKKKSNSKKRSSNSKKMHALST